uniref:Bowman-Birk serine protease inhibitors family domain-containing protein n=1 Tax=Oryza glumipatula TaxID=40148 RepID=A0A0E0B2N4_9ORYZ
MASATAVKIAAIFMVALTIGQLMAEASSSSSTSSSRGRRRRRRRELDEATLLADELATIVQGCRSICHRHPKSWRCRCCRERPGCHRVLDTCVCPAACFDRSLMASSSFRYDTDPLP